MVVPIVVAGARVAAGAAVRGTASRTAAKQAGTRAVAGSPKPVRNPFPVARAGDTPVPGKQAARTTPNWQQVKKRRVLKETQRLIAEAQERDDLEDDEREALFIEQQRLQADAEQNAVYAQEAAMAEKGSTAHATKKTEQRVGTVAMFLMLTLSSITDAVQFLLQFIPGAGQILAQILAFTAGAFFFLWFFLLGVSYFSGKFAPVKIGSIFVGAVVELVPFINALPALTPTVLAIILASRAEDALSAKSGQPAKKAPVAKLRLRPQRLTQQ